MLECTLAELSGHAKVIQGWYVSKCLRTLTQIQADTPHQIKLCTDVFFNTNRSIFPQATFAEFKPSQRHFIIS